MTNIINMNRKKKIKRLLEKMKESAGGEACYTQTFREVMTELCQTIIDEYHFDIHPGDLVITPAPECKKSPTGACVYKIQDEGWGPCLFCGKKFESVVADGLGVEFY